MNIRQDREFAPGRLSLETRKLIERIRSEPLTKDFLKSLFLSRRFINALNEMRTRLLRYEAEGGIIVYKRIGTDDFKLIRRYGMPETGPGDTLWRAVKSEDPHVFAGDNPTQLKHLGVRPDTHVRIGEFHTHPGGDSFYDSEDFDLFLGVNLSDRWAPGELGLIIPAAYEMFNLAGGIPKSRSDMFEIFGFSLPHGGERSTIYQTGDFRGPEELERMLLQSGFNMVRVKINVVAGKLEIDPENLEKLACLGR